MYRVGNGYDVHKICKDRDLILGGVKIDWDRGLLGHSDADVLIHAIMDALLGAMGQADIGTFFPDSAMEYKNISSMILLAKVYEIMEEKKYEVVNIDTVIVAQQPKLAKYIDQMKENISEILKTSRDQIGIKATTEEKLGFTGNEEGMKAYAVVMLKQKV